MSKIAAVAAVLMLALSGSAIAQDFRSPDAKPQIVTQDYRSPDARAPMPQTSAPGQDFRSPDARPAGTFQPAVPTEPVASGSFDWGYLALGIGIALILLASLVVSQRRRRHGLAIGR